VGFGQMNGNEPVDQLSLGSSRVWKVLLHANLKTVGAVHRSFKNGEVKQDRNCGPTTLAATCKPVGLSPP
jgi:hypothetical protein